MSAGHDILGHPGGGHESAGHESRDASVRMVLVILAGLAASVLAVAVIVYGIFWYMADHPLSTAPPNPMAVPVQIPPAPRIDDHPWTELKDLHGYEDTILSTYGWTDKNKGIVRIPLDQAMQMEMERGFPTRPEASSKTGAQKK